MLLKSQLSTQKYYTPEEYHQKKKAELSSTKNLAHSPLYWDPRGLAALGPCLEMPVNNFLLCQVTEFKMSKMPVTA